MFLLFGTSLHDRVLTVVHFVCTACGVAAPQQVIERATRFSLFFIPLFTVGRRHSVVCTNCGTSTGRIAASHLLFDCRRATRSSGTRWWREPYEALTPVDSISSSSSSRSTSSRNTWPDPGFSVRSL